MARLAESRGDLDEAISWYTELFDTLDEYEDKDETLACLHTLYVHQNEWDPAIQVVLKQMRLVDEEFPRKKARDFLLFEEKRRKQVELQEEHANLLCQKGEAHWSRGILTEAVICLDQAVKLFQEIGESEQAERASKELAQVYVERGDRKKRESQLAGAEENYRQARSIYRRINDVSKESEILYKLGQLMKQRGRSVEARSYLEDSLGIWRDFPEDKEDKKDLDSIAAAKESLAELLPPMEAMCHLGEAVTIRAHQLNRPEAERLWQQANQWREQIGAISLPKEIQGTWDKAEQALTNLREATSPSAV